MVAIALALMAGWRVNGWVTLTPIFARRVCCAQSVRYAYTSRPCNDESHTQM